MFWPRSDVTLACALRVVTFLELAGLAEAALPISAASALSVTMIKNTPCRFVDLRLAVSLSRRTCLVVISVKARVVLSSMEMLWLFEELVIVI